MSTCLIVAAATSDGTARAVKCLHQLERLGVGSDVVRLALVRDGRGPIPVAARSRVRLLSSIVAGVVVVPHVLRWRYESAEQRTRNRRYDRAVDVLSRQVSTSLRPDATFRDDFDLDADDPFATVFNDHDNYPTSTLGDRR